MLSQMRRCSYEYNALARSGIDSANETWDAAGDDLRYGDGRLWNRVTGNLGLPDLRRRPVSFDSCAERGDRRSAFLRYRTRCLPLPGAPGISPCYFPPARRSARMAVPRPGTVDPGAAARLRSRCTE